MARSRKPLTIILDYVLSQLGDVQEITEVEINGDSIWITYEDKTVKSILIHDCEPDNEQNQQLWKRNSHPT